MKVCFSDRVLWATRSKINWPVNKLLVEFSSLFLTYHLFWNLEKIGERKFSPFKSSTLKIATLNNNLIADNFHQLILLASSSEFHWTLHTHFVDKLIGLH